MHSQRSKRRKRSHKLKMSDDIDDETPIGGIRAPIVGYEVVDRREKFTVYKVQVRNREKSWYVFRRYTDFVRLNDKLQDSFPGFHFKLPAKRWFKNNFDPDFIEERARGLQFFISSVMRHSSICKSEIVKEFLCLDDPPGPYDSLEESRAYCQQLEDEVEDIKETMMEMTSELSATKSQLAQARIQQEALVQSLKEERATNSLRRNTSDDSEPFQAISNNWRRDTDEQEHNRVDGDDSSWMGNVEITAHSEGVNRLKPIPRKLLTSTPEKASHLASFHTANDLTTLTAGENSDKDDDLVSSALDSSGKALNNTEASNARENEIMDEISNSPTVDEFEDHNSDTDDELSEIKDACSNNMSSKQSSKRDSGIVADTGLSPLAT